VSLKFDHPPLLAPGRHFLSLQEIERLCVHPFQGQARDRRERLFYAFEEMIQQLLIARLPCEVFVDGSFFTAKLDPSDVDCLVAIEHSVMQILTQDQRLLVDALNQEVYSYSGSLGIVLLAQNEKDFFEGRLDGSIDALFQVMDIDSRDAVRDIGKALGTAVVKRIHDWSAANIKGGFAADVRWNKSDGRQVGEVIERRRMESIVEIIEATSDEHTDEIVEAGILVGGDLGSGSFHFVVPNGEDYRGHLAEEFSHDSDMTLGNRYVARIRETSTTTYSTQRVERKRELLSLNLVPNATNHPVVS
jgi:hypothetical protein